MENFGVFFKEESLTLSTKTIRGAGQGADERGNIGKHISTEDRGRGTLDVHRPGKKPRKFREARKGDLQ